MNNATTAIEDNTTGNTAKQNQKPTKEEAKARLLAAAHKMRERTKIWIRAQHELAELQSREHSAQIELKDIDLELAKYDAELTNARLSVLKLKQQLRKQRIEKTANGISNTRRDFWRICVEGSDDEIIAAAVRLGEADTSYFVAVRACQAAEEALEKARQDFDAILQARSAVAEKQAAVRETLKEIQGRCAEVYCEQQIFGLESATAAAAIDLTETSDKQFAFSFVEIQDLGLTKPEFLLPASPMPNAEGIEYYWAQREKPETRLNLSVEL